MRFLFEADGQWLTAPGHQPALPSYPTPVILRLVPARTPAGELDPQRRAGETECRSKAIDQVAMIRLRNVIRPVADDRNHRRAGANL